MSCCTPKVTDKQLLGILFLFCLLHLAALVPTSLSCNCNTGYSCCHEKTHGAMCYNPVEYACLEGRLCPAGDQLCGSSCYDPHFHQCIDSSLLCQVSDDVCSVQGKRQCYNRYQYHCFNGNLLCKLREAECAGACYDPSSHQCFSGTLCSINESICMVNGSPQCYNTESQKCFNNQIICEISQEVCNSQCYNPSRHTCSNGELTPAATEELTAADAEPTNATLTCFGIDSQNAEVCSGNGQCIRSNICSCRAGYHGRQCSKSATNPTLFMVGQNDIDELAAYAQAFVQPAGGSIYSNIFLPSIGTAMEDYLAKMNRNYPGSKILFGLDAKGMYHTIYGGYDNNKKTVEMMKDIVEGNRDVDAHILSVANSLKKYTSLTILLRIEYEVSGNLHANTNPSAWDRATQDPSFYKRGFCKIANKFRELQVTNVEFVYHPTRGEHEFLYPDPSCVDWIGLSVFNNDVALETFDGEKHYWNNQTGIIDVNLKQAFDWAKATGKKLIIAESSVQRPYSRSFDGMKTYFGRVLNIVDSYKPEAWVYINSNWLAKEWSGEWDDSRIESKSAEMQQWWRTNVINSPRFIHYN